MKKNSLLFSGLLFLIQLVGPMVALGNRTAYDTLGPTGYSASAAISVIVAGGNGEGSAANQLRYPNSIFVDANGNLFVTDGNNNRIQKWTPGATEAITVATGNASDVFVDADGNIYFTETFNHVVKKWAPGASSAITVAGGNGDGSAANQLSAPFGLFVDKSGNIYIADQSNNRVQKWAPGASSGVTIAGGNGQGAAANQFHTPLSVFVDEGGNLYVTDNGNSRIQKWAPGATAGITVAGGNGPGFANNQLNFNAVGVFVDGSGNIYIADQYNHRIQKWAPGASEGYTVAGGNYNDAATNQLNFPRDVFVDPKGSIYVGDMSNHRVLKFGSGDGLGYEYFEGNWSTLPDFNALTPVKTGKSANIDINARTPGRNDNFGFIWEGSIYIPYPGTYTFELISDDGSNLYFNKQYGAAVTPTVNNDGLHASKSATGTATVAALGAYPITITYMESSGDEGIQVYWSGPGVPRQRIPDEAFTMRSVYDDTPPSAPSNLHVVAKGGNFITLDWDDATDNVGVTAYDVYVGGVLTYSTIESQITADNLLSRNNQYTFTVKARDLRRNGSPFSNAVTETTTGTANGLTYKYYEGSFNTLPDFSKLTPVKTGNSLNVDIGERTPGRNDNFAFVWEGYINIPAPGNYTFETISDDGSKLYFNSLYIPSATPTVDNDGLHASTSATGTVNITTAGVYPISISFFEKDGGETMQVYWSGPGIPRQPIPNSAFTEGPTPPKNGLTYRYYEGSWNMLPDFSVLAPVKTGTSDNIDLNVRTAGRNDNFAFVWEGYIDIPAAGTYTFETVSDDGSNLYFNSLYNPSAVPTVSNDGVHASRSASGTVTVPAAGAYPVSITFFEKDGGEQMQVYWSGPGITRQLIPNSAFTQAPLPPPPPPQSGLNYRYYEGTWSALPDFNTLTPVKTGSSPNVDLNVRTPGRNDNFGLVWEGYINIPAAGNYTFETVSDDGSRLWFNSLYNPSAIPLVNNDGLHAPRSAGNTVTIAAAGVYPIALSFFEQDGGETMQVYWAGPGIQRQLIPGSAFMQKPPVTSAVNAGKNNTLMGLADRTTAGSAISSIYPNPFTKSFQVAFNNSSAGNDIMVNVYDLKGRLVYQQHAGKLPKGNNLLKVGLEGRHLPPGVYMAGLKINGLPSKMVKMVKTE